MSAKLIRRICLLLTLLCIFSLLCGCSRHDGNIASNVPASTTTSATTTTVTTTTNTTTTNTTNTTSTTTKRTTTVPRSTTTGTAGGSLKDKVLSVPIIAQFPDYPTGCESVCAVMALRYYGETIDVGTFIQEHLPMSNHFPYIDGVKYGPDPNKYFIGHPSTESSYGCMAPVIEQALVSYFGSDERIKNTTGTPLSTLCTQYIDNGEPVLVWATIGMIETGKGPSWKLEDGSTFYWPLNEHCMILIGYDESRYYFADPYRGMVKSYARWLCESRYKDLGMQSIAITK